MKRFWVVLGLGFFFGGASLLVLQESRLLPQKGPRQGPAMPDADKNSPDIGGLVDANESIEKDSSIGLNAERAIRPIFDVFGDR